ncbi:MAG: hypothetical protein A3D67_00685 [Candidatus Lloydbacteria bacterium RIFCSPHIGHO2_02_FULL_51_22]|uniref:Uncharacterized protein n=3 Tax=Candidatus Lloydiibacteriota TaxID=1817910 RepID=A0A1G2DFM3_9BACT|nr:MAG: hypothetical protein A3D67_00685 [Candidatus Lloydbacteria bacterium RIFCSPHIGHO2_02_FULL_51_22]OGZ15879.1 MAG: hypothetical protein A3J08_04545 [Candidatus Lloydbacteria bacterium RIFCSPLOWO2_02_FULL_51_11]OGZ16244.1 MAG: hypothetical protein A3G11_00095 [Candidatus Lloydbacteria bacterium RIFCSPLOWO2_12_FULL_51_9]
MEKTLINIKIDKTLKVKVQKVAKELGFPLGTLINAYLRDLVRERRVVISAGLTPNTRTMKILEEIEEDIKNDRNASGPFNREEAIAYLRSL